MREELERTVLLLGEDKCNRLEKCRVAVFGVGGVGGYVCEALARSGVGQLDLIDKDVVSVSNINRQIIALHSTIGKYKTEVMKTRIDDINPECKVICHNCFFMPENSGQFDFSQYDYVVDAVDTVTAKIEMVMKCRKTNTKIISSMGAGNKLNPAEFEVSDIYKTSVCPLARAMRQQLKKRGVDKLKVVYSREQALTPKTIIKDEESGKICPGSIAFVPSVAGLIIASEVVKDLCENKND